MNKKFIKHFLRGFFSVFRLGPIKTKNIKEGGELQDLSNIRDDLNIAFKKLKNEYERN